MKRRSGRLGVTQMDRLPARGLLDTCATAEEAKEALLTVKQYYFLVPCHYIVADRAGHSFIYENSTGRNVQHVIDGVGKPQVVTNFQVCKHPQGDAKSAEALTIENNAFWRHATLSQRIAEHHAPFTTEDLKANNACVNVQTLLAEMSSGQAAKNLAANVQARTLWHSLYDQHAKTVEFSFYLGDVVHADGTRTERRSDYLKFTLAA